MPCPFFRRRFDRTVLALIALVITSLCMLPSSLYASSYVITITTSTLSGTAAQLAFDLIDGGPPSNSATITDFTTTGALGPFSIAGGVTGSLPGPVTLTDSSFFNEYLASLTIGQSLFFTLTTTDNAPALGSSPDAFSVFLLNPSTGVSLFDTTDPTGSNALFVLDLTGIPQGTLHPFSVPSGDVVVAFGTPTAAVPEPHTFGLVLSGIIALGLFRFRRVGPTI